MITQNPALREERTQKPRQENEANEELLSRNLFYNQRVLRALQYLHNQLQNASERIAEEVSIEGKPSKDMYLPNELIKMFNGLEIHSLRKAFSRYKTGITKSTFVLVGLSVLDYKLEQIIQFVKGKLELYTSLAQMKTLKTSAKHTDSLISFEDLISYLYKMETLFNSNVSLSHEIAKTSGLKRFGASTCFYDSHHHDNPIKIACYDSLHKLIFCLEDSSSFIQIYDCKGNLIRKLTTDNSKHRFDNMLINSFTWSKKEQRLCLCCQDQTISFFEWKDGFKAEYVYQTKILQVRVWYLEEYQLWLFNDVQDTVSFWNEEKRQLDPINVNIGAALSDVVSMPNLSLLVLAAFNKKLVLWNMRLKCKFMEIPLTDTSAHTLRYYPGTGYLYAATFDQTAKVYQIDKSKDYTIVAKLDHTTSITAMEMITELELLLTCDGSGVIKSWDVRTFKCIQSLKLPNKINIGQIQYLAGENMFFCVTNRIQFFHFGSKDDRSSQDYRILPNIGYDKNCGKIIVGTPFDLRSFNLRYGVLVDLFDKEGYMIEDKIVNFIFRKEDGKIMCLTDKNDLMNLCALEKSSRNTLSITKLFPENQLKFVHYIQKYHIVISCSAAKIKFHKFEQNTTITFLREVCFPEQYTITGISVNTRANFLVVVLNSMFAVFLEFEKCRILGCYLSYVPDSDEIVESSQDGLHAETKRISRRVKKSPSRVYPGSPKCIKSPIRLFKTDQVSRFDPGKGSFESKADEALGLMSPFNVNRGTAVRRKISVSPARHVALSHTDYDAMVMEDLGNISHLLCLKYYNCCLTVDNDNQIMLFEPADFPKIKSKIRLIWQDMPISSAFISTIKCKRISKNESNHSSESLNEARSGKDSSKLSNLLVESKNLFETIEETESSTGKITVNDDQHYLMLGDSAGRITVVELTGIVSHSFTPLPPRGSFNPYYKANSVIKDQEITNIVDLSWNHYCSENYPVQSLHLTEKNCKNWQAHRGEVTSLKMISYVKDIVISIGIDMYLRVWSLQAEKLCELSLATMKYNRWNLLDFPLEQNKTEMSVITEFINELESCYPDLREKMSSNSANALTVNRVSQPTSVLIESNIQNSPLQSHNYKEPISQRRLKGERSGLSISVEVDVEQRIQKEFERLRKDEQRKREEEYNYSLFEKVLLNSLAERNRNAHNGSLPSVERTINFEKKLDNIANSFISCQSIVQEGRKINRRPLPQINRRSNQSSIHLPNRKNLSLDYQSTSRDNTSITTDRIESQNRFSTDQSFDLKALKRTDVNNVNDEKKLVARSERYKLSGRSGRQESPTDNPLSSRRDLRSQRYHKYSGSLEFELRNPNFKQYYCDVSNNSVNSRNTNQNDITLNSEIRGKDCNLSTRQLNQKYQDKLQAVMKKDQAEEFALFDSEKLRTNRETRQCILKELDSKLKKIQNLNSNIKLQNNHRSAAQLNGIARTINSGKLPSLKHLNNISTMISPTDRSFLTNHRSIHEGTPMSKDIPKIHNQSHFSNGAIKTDRDLFQKLVSDRSSSRFIFQTDEDVGRIEN